MAKIPKAPEWRNSPLGHYADIRRHAELPLNAKRLSRRFAMPPETASVLSELVYGQGGAR